MTVRTKAALKALITAGQPLTEAQIEDIIDSYQDYSDPSVVSDQQLKEWAEGGCYELTAITYNGSFSTIMASATVKWPDGSAGTLTVTAQNTTYLKETAYTITHTVSGKTVTQAAVTLNTDGNITVKPALTVA